MKFQKKIKTKLRISNASWGLEVTTLTFSAAIPGSQKTIEQSLQISELKWFSTLNCISIKLSTKHKNKDIFRLAKSWKIYLPTNHSFSGSSWRGMQNKGIIQGEKSHRSQSTRDPNNKRKGQRNSQEEGKGSLLRMLWNRL